MERNTYFEELRQDVDRLGPDYFGAGPVAALVAYEGSIAKEAATFEVESLPDPEDIPAFISTLQLAGERRFNVVKGNKDFFNTLFALREADCLFDGVSVFKRKNPEALVKAGAPEEEIVRMLSFETPYEDWDDEEDEA